MSRAVMKCAALVLVVALLVAMFPTVALGQTPSEPTGTLPSTETVRSLLMNNWTDTIAVHYSRQLYKDDALLFGPYLAALHNAADWPVNQIDGATALFRAEALEGNSRGELLPGTERPPTLCESSGEMVGDDAAADPGVRYSYPSAMCFDDGGILHVEYLRETERSLPIQIEKSYAMAPYQRFLVVRYKLINNVPPEDNRSVRVRFAEVVDVNNKAALDHEESADDLVDTGIHEPQPGQPINDIRAQWYPELNAWIADMSTSNGTFLTFGAFQVMDQHRAFETAGDDIAFNDAISPEMDTFEQPVPPSNIDELTAQDQGLSLWKETDLAPGHEQEYAFFYTVTSSLEGARNVAIQARWPMTSDFWFDQTAAAYQSWLQEGKQAETPDPGLRKAYNKALITIKQSQQPQFGSFVAATNPAYGYKVWPRDSSVTALGLAAAGHLGEAVKFFRWMASVQENGSQELFHSGTWYTNYGFWAHKRPKEFVYPEWDSSGLFLIGVYHTWRLLDQENPEAAREFLTGSLESGEQGPSSIFEAVTRAAEFIENNLNEFNFGHQDRSIWEEDLEWATFTHVTYASGLNAARLLAEAMGETGRASEWTNGTHRLLEALHRGASSGACPGLWNDAEERWNRGTKPDCTPDDRLDASTGLVWVFGLVDQNDERAMLQREEVLSRLTPGEDDIGITRYEGDNFYYASEVSPGGPFEASAEMPSWPQMDMYMGILEHWIGLDEIALARLQWYAKVTNAGYMPPGEAIDWPTDRPLPSTASEPVTGSWYILGLLNFLNQFDPRLPPLESAEESLSPNLTSNQSPGLAP